MKRGSAIVSILVALWAGAFMTSLVRGQAPAQFSNLYIPTSQTWAQISANMPAANYSYGTLALSTDVGLLFDNGSAWAQVYTRISAISTSIGGSALLLGQCATQDVSVPGAIKATMVATTSPVTTQPTGVQWQAQIIADGTVRVFVCALLSVTPTASLYNVKVAG